MDSVATGPIVLPCDGSDLAKAAIAEAGALATVLRPPVPPDDRDPAPPPASTGDRLVRRTDR